MHRSGRAVMEIHELSLHPGFRASLALFQDVTNVGELRQRLMDGSIDAACIKPSMMLNRFQVLTAAMKAVHNQQSGKTITKTLHTEVLYSLSPNKKISDCFRTFGVGADDSSVLVVKIEKGASNKMAEICSQIKGKQVSLDGLVETADESCIKKVYKVSDKELQVGSLLQAVVSHMATKDFVS